MNNQAISGNGQAEQTKRSEATDKAQAQVDQARERVFGNAAAQCSVGQAPEQVVIVESKIKAIEDIESALRHVIRHRGKITRLGWNGSRMHVEAQWPDRNSKMGKPYLFITDNRGVSTPWVPSQGDLFANDWALLPPEYINPPF